MQPSDQDELRKQAQRAMQRRIDTSARRAEEPTQTQERPAQQRQQPQPRPNAQRRRQEARDAAQRREMDERRAREQQQAPALEERPPQRIEVVEAPRIEAEEPMARTERVRHDTSVSTSSIHSGIHSNIHGNIHQNVHGTPYSRASVDRRNQRIISDLHDVEARRRAIVIAEILGKPVALREQDGTSGTGVI